MVEFQPRTAAIRTLDYAPLNFIVTTSVPAVTSFPMKSKLLVILCPAPLDPLAPRDASPPVPPTVPSIASSASDSEYVNAFVPVSSAAAASALSRAPFQSIPVYYHHRQATHAHGRLVAFSHRSSIGRVTINCATVFCLRRIDVRIQTIPTSFIAPANEG